MNKSANRILILIAILCLAMIATQFVILGRTRPSSAANAHALEEFKALASRFSTQGLSAEAIAQYQAALSLSSAPFKEKANLAYLAGNIAYEDLKDSRLALTYYQRSLFYDPSPDQAIKTKINERIAESQERLGRSLDAAQTLAAASRLKGKETPAAGEKIAARIGDREIPVTEIDAAIRRLPPPAQPQFADAETKRDFARNYVAGEVLLEKAKREGLDRDPEVIEAIGQAERQFTLQKLLQKEVSEKISVSPEETDLYYKAHKEEFASPRQVRVAQILLSNEKAAAQAKERLDKGEKFEALAKELSEDKQTKANGGEIPGWVIDRAPLEIPGVPDSAGAARDVLALKPGQATKPIQGKDGIRLFTVLQAVDAEQRTFEQSKPEIEGRLRQEKEMAGQKKLIEDQMAAREAKIYDDAFGLSSAVSAPAGKK